MNIQIVHTLPRHQWETFVENHPKGNIFHTPEMFQVYERAKGHIPGLWAAVHGDQILALFIPVQVALRNNSLSCLTTRSVVFGSILAVPDEEGCNASKLLLQAYKNDTGRKSLFTELRNVSPPGELLAVMLEEGFVYEEHLNYLIDLDCPANVLFQNIGKRTRRNIKNGLNKAQVIIEEVERKSDLTVCYELLDKTYCTAHVPLADYSLFNAAFDILLPMKMIRFTVAKVDEKPVAASIELLYKDVLYGWYGGIDREYSSYVPNELLMWHILKWGSENGFKKYDFGGAGKPNEEYGVRDFKAKFGGDLVCYGRNTWAGNPALFSISKFAYSVLRKILF